MLTPSAADARPYLGCVLDGYAPVRVEYPVRARWSPDLGFARTDPEVESAAQAAAQRLASAGVVRLDGRALTLLDPAEAWQSVRRGDPSAGAAVRTDNDRRLDALFADVDLLLTPSTPNRPHGHDGPGELYSTALTWAFNLSGHPAASIPAGFTSDGCPVGLQLVTPRGSDVSLLEMAVAAEPDAIIVRP